MIHAPFRPSDPERNWQTRLDAEAAERAMRADRHARNVHLTTFWTEVLGTVALGVLFVVGLVAVYRAGLFAWLTN